MSKIEEVRVAVNEIRSHRETVRQKASESFPTLESMGGYEAVKHLPLHEIEETLGYDRLPFVDRGGRTYPSLYDMHQKREEIDRRLAIRLGEIPKPSVPERIQNHIVRRSPRIRGYK